MKKINSIWFGPRILLVAIGLLLLALVLYVMSLFVDGALLPSLVTFSLGASAATGLLLFVILAIEHAQDKKLNIPVEALPGTHKQSFPMFFAGTEIWFSHLDGMHAFTEEVIQKFLRDIPRIAKPSAPALVAIILDETVVTAPLMTVLTDKLIEISSHVQKVALVGLKPAVKRRMERMFRDKMTSAEPTFSVFAIHYTNDLEAAKEWLAGR
jgi:hypothetical protein